jgi:hypothetical protein
VVLVMATFLSGAFVGRCAINADGPGDLVWTLIGIYSVLVFMCRTAGLSFAETAPLLGMASVGFVCSSFILLRVSRRFPLHRA